MPSRASTAAPLPASPGTAATTPSSASRCARTATTTPPTWCGTTRPANYGGAPSKPSNAASTRPPGTAAWLPRSASRTARPPNTRPAAQSTSTPCSASTATTPPTRTGSCPRHLASPSPTWTRPPGRPPPPSATAPRRTPPSPAAGHHLGHRDRHPRHHPAGTGTVTDLAVASYLAKYSTKGTEPAGHASARITTETIDLYASPGGTHPERLIHACWRIGQHPGYVEPAPLGPHARLRRPLPHQSPPLLHPVPDLRQARITYRRRQDTGPDHGPIRTADHTDDETILIVGTFTYAGTGWKTTGDALLANTAADQARKRRQAGRDQLADEYNDAVYDRQAA